MGKSLLEFVVPDMKSNYKIRIRNTSEIIDAVWSANKFVGIKSGVAYATDEVDTLRPFFVECQIWEWYGNEDSTPNDQGIGGRYKAKGGETVIVYLTEDEAMYGDFDKKLRDQMTKEGRYIKYEPKTSLFPYNEPTVLDYSVEADAFVLVKH